jgi:hypothetical protein
MAGYIASCAYNSLIWAGNWGGTARPAFLAQAMPRDGATTFGDLVGRLGAVQVTCEKCGRDGRYRLYRLIAQHGRDTKIPDWLSKISGDCPRRIAARFDDRCGAHCPDLLPIFRAAGGFFGGNPHRDGRDTRSPLGG